MPSITRSSKRKLTESSQDEPERKKRHGLKNLTNFKSPKNVASLLVKSKDSSATSHEGQLSSKQTTSAPEFMPMTQSNEIVISQLPNNNSSNNSTRDDGVRMMRCIKKVLEVNFKNVSERLQLESVHPCLYNLKNCHQNHSTKNRLTEASQESKYLAKNYTANDRHVQFILFVRDSLCGVKEFPGASNVRGILELILKTCNESCISTSQILTDLHSLFISVLTTFPTCHTRKSYLEMFQMPFKVTGITLTSPNLAIVPAMIELLNDLVHSKPPSTSRTPKRLVETAKLNNFFFWDAQNDEKSLFDNFTREVKLQRVFMVLDLITRVLEQDLAMFMIKYSNKLQTSLASSTHQPLISHVLWQSHESVMVINSTIKNLISVFVTISGLQFPKENIRVISRLLNLVSHVSNLHEYPNETFEYPSYKNITLDLVREIQKTVEKSVYCDMESFLGIIEQMRSPLMQMLLADQLFQKIHQLQCTISLEVPFDFIRLKKFEKFKDIPKVLEDNKEKYPLHDLKKKVLKFHTTQEEYLKLLRIYAEAFNSFYQIQRGLDEISKTESSIKPEDPPKSSFSDFSNFEKKLEEVDLNEPVNLKSIDLSFKKLAHIHLSVETCEFYRKEVKFLMLFKKLIAKCFQKYGEKFRDLHEFSKRLDHQ